MTELTGQTTPSFHAPDPVMGNFTDRSRTSRCNALLIMACSATKFESEEPIPAIELYDGVNYRLLKKFLREEGMPEGLEVRILSAKHGLIEPNTLIEPYNERLNPTRAGAINADVLELLATIEGREEVFVNLGKDYLPAIEGIEEVFPNIKIGYARGGIGVKMKEMKGWLQSLIK
jgi:hypothetical protein